MTITNTTIRKTFTEGKLKAIVSVTIDNAIAIHEIRIIQLNENLLVAMPSKQENDSFRDIVHPMNSETRSLLETAVINAYLTFLENQKAST